MIAVLLDTHKYAMTAGGYQATTKSKRIRGVQALFASESSPGSQCTMRNDCAKLPQKTNPMDFLPQQLSYYRFMGSLTHPPCTQGVRWFSLRQQGTISQAAVNNFKKAMLFNKLKHAASHNNREVQRLNSRQICVGGTLKAGSRLTAPEEGLMSVMQDEAKVVEHEGVVLAQLSQVTEVKTKTKITMNEKHAHGVKGSRTSKMKNAKVAKKYMLAPVNKIVDEVREMDESTNEDTFMEHSGSGHQG